MSTDQVYEHIPLKNSIASRLFRIVFSIYFLFTFCLTLAQMYTEYIHTKQEIVREMKQLVSAIEPVLSQSIWNFDMVQVNLIIDILNKQAIIDGVIIEDEKGLLKYDIPQSDLENTNEFGPDLKSKMKHTDKNKFEFEIFSSYGQKMVGNGTLYYSDKAVFQRVRYGFLLIIINSLLKTIALWVIFLIVSRSILARPMKQLIRIIRNINLDNLDQVSIRIKSKGNNELKIIENTLRQMVQNLMNARAKIRENAKELEDNNKKLQEIDKLKDEILANTSHELRTPLHGIIGIANSLKEHLKGAEFHKVQFNLDMIVKAGKHLSLLVDDILDFSKMKHQPLQLQRKPVDIKLILNFVQQISQSLLDEKKLIIEKKFPDGLPHVYADENRLQQIFQNLIGNAIKFTDQGTIQISALNLDTHVEISLITPSDPIPADQYEIIFEAFEQQNRKIDKKHAGAGLGLAIVKKLVERHDGKIWVVSNERDGNIFTFTLPIAEAIMTSSETALTKKSITMEANTPIPLIQEKKYKNALFNILVVDDDVANLQVIMNFLTPYGYSINCVQSGIEALGWIDTHERPDLVLLDVMMPQTSGFEVCRILREKYALENLPIIFLTASHSRKDIKTGFALGANDFLTKPFEKFELLSRIRVHLKHLLARKQLQLLRNCANQIGSFKEHEQMLSFILQEMVSNRLVSDTVLFKENKVYRSASPEFDFLNHHPNAEVFDAYSKDQGSEIIIINSIQEDDQIHKFYLKHQSNIDIQGGHLVFIKPPSCQENLIGFFRSKERMPFNELDIEFLSNVLEQIRTIEKNIQTMLSNQLVQVLPIIQPNLSKISYISSASPDCSIYFENEAKPHEVKILISSLDLYFSDESLLRIHRSYLINPKKIVSIKNQYVGNKRYRHEVVIRHKMRHVTLRVGDSYVQKLKKTLPQFFSQT